MAHDSGSTATVEFFAPRARDSRAEESGSADGPAPASYWLLLCFLILLYANLPLVLPATEVVRPAKVVGGAALLMLLVEVATGRRRLDLAWPEGFLLLGFVGAGALSCLSALWPHLAVDALSDLGKMALVYFFIVNCADTEKRLKGVMWTMVICGLLPAMGTLRSYLQGNLDDGRADWVGIFGNPNEVAYSLIILIPLAAYLAKGSGAITRTVLLGLTAVFLAAIYVTFSRGGMVALAAVILLYGWRKRSLGLQLAMVILIGAGFVIGSKYWTREEAFTDLRDDVSFQQRIATSKVGLDMFADHPVLGVGLGCSVVAWPLYAPNNLYSRGALVTHNTFVQALGETGSIGFILFGLLVGFGVYYARGMAVRKSPTKVPGLGIGLECAFWGFIICGLSGGYVLTWFPYILLGLISSARRLQEER